MLFSNFWTLAILLPFLFRAGGFCLGRVFFARVRNDSLGGGLARQFLFAFFLHLGIRALEDDQVRFVGVDFPDLGGDGVHEVAVMGDEQDRAL